MTKCRAAAFAIVGSLWASLIYFSVLTSPLQYNEHILEVALPPDASKSKHGKITGLYSHQSGGLAISSGGRNVTGANVSEAAGPGSVEPAVALYFQNHQDDHIFGGNSQERAQFSPPPHTHSTDHFPLFDVVIPMHTDDTTFVVDWGMLDLVRANVVGYRYIYLLCWHMPALHAKYTDVKWLDESLFVPLDAFNRSRSWKLRAMALKLYAQRLVPEMLDFMLHIDADVMFLRKWTPWTPRIASDGTDRCPLYKQHTAVCPKLIIGRGAQGKSCVDVGRKVNLLGWVQKLAQWKPFPTHLYKDGCIPINFDETATNHHGFYDRKVLEQMHLASDHMCPGRGHAHNDSLAALMAGLDSFGCGIAGFWPSETEMYFLFKQLYFPAQFLTVFPAWGDSLVDCSPSTQRENTEKGDLLYIACHDQHYDVKTDGFLNGGCVNSHTGCFNGKGQAIVAVAACIGKWPEKLYGTPEEGAAKFGFCNYPSQEAFSPWVNNYSKTVPLADPEWWRSQEFTNL
mmetsp:Transcript_26115/g.37084  ORF Transcript_26115/g.37084 Transcript_26115/m.37084 type:complete len:512 (+) Transcript_26115:22-1557(+)